MRLFASSLILAVLVPSASALRVAFLADTGIGNDRPSDPWTNYRGETVQPSYKVDGVECKTFDGKYCGQYSRAQDVFRLARESGVDLIVHAGDLDYVSSPRSWLRFLTEHVFRHGIRGYVATKGNHDVDGWDGVDDLWSGPEGYQALLSRQIPRGSTFRGSYGEDAWMEMDGVLFVFSSVGSERPGESANQDHYRFLEEALRRDAKWKVCVWHMTMNSLQSSYKQDATGYRAYEICRHAGACIVSGHAHMYSRSYTMKRFGTKVYGFTREDLQVDNWNYDEISLRPGEDRGTTGVAVVGIGGYKNEAQLTDSGIWAKVYSTSCLQDSGTSCERARDANKYGTLICDFNADSDRAPCWLATVARPGASRESRARRIESVRIDEFTLRRRG